MRRRTVNFVLPPLTGRKTELEMSSVTFSPRRHKLPSKKRRKSPWASATLLLSNIHLLSSVDVHPMTLCLLELPKFELVD